MARGVRVPARVTHPISIGDFAGLADYQAGVGGMIEAIDVPLLGITIYVNEEGRLKQMEPNTRATYLWWYHVVESRQQAVLLGDVVIIGYPDENGESTDLPETLVSLFTNSGSYRVEVQWRGSERWIDHGLAYDDYFEALVWAMILNERFSPEQVKVVGQIDGLDATSG